jgi:hypothetical protein
MDGREEFVSEKEEHQFIIDDQNLCCLCGSKLSFQHKVDYMTMQVREDADCPSCHIRLKTRDHSLQ